MAIYNWQYPNWPRFDFNLNAVEELVYSFSEKTGRVSGILDSISDESKWDIIVNIILTEAMKTSEIEGEFPNRKDVLSSIRKNLGLHTSPEFIKDKSAAGLGELMIDVRNSYCEKLTEKKLFSWHTMLLGQYKILKQENGEHIRN